VHLQGIFCFLKLFHPDKLFVSENGGSEITDFFLAEAGEHRASTQFGFVPRVLILGQLNVLACGYVDGCLLLRELEGCLHLFEPFLVEHAGLNFTQSVSLLEIGSLLNTLLLLHFVGELQLPDVDDGGGHLELLRIVSAVHAGQVAENLRKANEVVQLHLV
jgi:hypothetical protein